LGCRPERPLHQRTDFSSEVFDRLEAKLLVKFRADMSL